MLGNDRHLFSFQLRDFVRGQIPPLTRLETAKFQSADPQTDDLHHRQPKQFANFTDLPLLSLPHHNSDPRAFTR